MSEIDAMKIIDNQRAQLQDFVGLSFDTISAAGPNASFIHYKPAENDCSILKKHQIYLCDSGGHYLDGSTDVTRTVFITDDSSSIPLE